MKIEKLKKKIKPLLEKEGVKRAGIFGSYARGEQKKDSDVDILAKIPAKLSLLDLVKIKIELEKVLKRKVDLVEYEYIHPLIKKQALAEEVRII